MTHVVSFPLENGGALWVESNDPLAGYGTRGLAADDVETATATFESALGPVRDAASSVLAALRDLEARPDTVQVQFGISLSGRIGAILSSAAGEAHFMVSLSWTRTEQVSR